MPEIYHYNSPGPEEDEPTIQARKRIKEVRDELIDSGESAEDADRWLQPHLDDLVIGN